MHSCIREGDLLAAAVTRTVQAGAEVLAGGDPPDLQALDEARRAHRRPLDEWAAAERRRGAPPEVVLAGLDHDQYLRVDAYSSCHTSVRLFLTVQGRNRRGRGDAKIRLVVIDTGAGLSVTAAG